MTDADAVFKSAVDLFVSTSNSWQHITITQPIWPLRPGVSNRLVLYVLNNDWKLSTFIVANTQFVSGIWTNKLDVDYS